MLNDIALAIAAYRVNGGECHINRPQVRERTAAAYVAALDLCPDAATAYEVARDEDTAAWSVYSAAYEEAEAKGFLRYDVNASRWTSTDRETDAESGVPELDAAIIRRDMASNAMLGACVTMLTRLDSARFDRAVTILTNADAWPTRVEIGRAPIPRINSEAMTSILVVTATPRDDRPESVAAAELADHLIKWHRTSLGSCRFGAIAAICEALSKPTEPEGFTVVPRGPLPEDAPAVA